MKFHERTVEIEGSALILLVAIPVLGGVLSALLVLVTVGGC